MYKMFKSRTSLVYTFRVEEIFEFLSKSVHPRNVHGSYRLYEDKYIPRYVHGTSLGCRVPVGQPRTSTLLNSPTINNKFLCFVKKLVCEQVKKIQLEFFIEKFLELL